MAATWLTIIGAAIVTYSLRLGGLLMADRLPRSGPVKRILDTLPGTILLALVAPAIYREGIWGLVAIVFVVLGAKMSKNALVGMLLGMAVIIIQRRLVG
jgi:uncharacterized membrane protein